jgi:hypothetical protein
MATCTPFLKERIEKDQFMNYQVLGDFKMPPQSKIKTIKGFSMERKLD